MPGISSSVKVISDVTLGLQNLLEATAINSSGATGDFSRHEERAAYRHVKHWPLSDLVA